MLRVTCATFGLAELLRPLRQPDADHRALAELHGASAPGAARARACPTARPAASSSGVSGWPTAASSLPLAAARSTPRAA